MCLILWNGVSGAFVGNWEENVINLIHFSHLSFPLIIAAVDREKKDGYARP